MQTRVAPERGPIVRWDRRNGGVLVRFKPDEWHLDAKAGCREVDSHSTPEHANPPNVDGRTGSQVSATPRGESGSVQGFAAKGDWQSQGWRASARCPERHLSSVSSVKGNGGALYSASQKEVGATGKAHRSGFAT